MKKLIEWVEQEPTRARRVMLFSTIFTYLLITIVIMILTACVIDMSKFANYYFSFSTVAAVCIGFYAGTRPKIPEPPKPEEKPEDLKSKPPEVEEPSEVTDTSKSLKYHFKNRVI